MRQTLAILIDAYRELNAKKLFWIALILSGLVIGLFALVGAGPNGLTLLTLKLPADEGMASYWYRTIFRWVVGFWAAWGAVVLALISTAGIFPDLMSSGSIDLYFSKPIGRLRLFLTKYASGLLFTVLQISVFAVGSFLVFGLRAHEWRPVLLLLVPLVTCLYSYLFAVCVLLGVLTRSTITAILLTVVLWLLFFGVNWAEGTMFEARVSQGYLARVLEDRVRQDDKELEQLKKQSNLLDKVMMRASRLRTERDKAELNAREARETTEKITNWHRGLYLASTCIPKTGETIELLDRKLFTEKDLENRTGFNKRFNEKNLNTAFGNNVDPDLLGQLADAEDAKLAAKRATRGRSVTWILGTSFAFEAVLIALAAWLFCRRDY